jgi:glycosyltransferase involved in cell wall biosynthesis
MEAPALTNHHLSRGARPRHVLFFGHSPLQGGAELCLDTTLRHLTPGKYRATVIFPREGPMAESARSLGLRVEIMPLAWWMNWPPSPWYYRNILFASPANILRLARFIRRERVDLVYTNTVSIFESAFAARLAGVPHVWHCHEVLGPGTTKHHVLPMAAHYRLIRCLSDRIIFESNSAKAACASLRDCEHSLVVYNSLRFPPDELAWPGESGRRRLGVAPGDLLVGFVGQFFDRKNPLMLVRAASLLQDRPGLKFLFVGDGPLRTDMVKQIEALGVADRCILIDFQKDIRWVMRALDVLALPSRQESFGLVLVEAGACGKPVIATRTEGPTEIVQDGETGFLVENDNAQDLAQKIELLARGGADRRQMGAAGARRVRELFSAGANTRRIETIIDGLLADAAGRKTRRQRASKNGLPNRNRQKMKDTLRALPC